VGKVSARLYGVSIGTAGTRAQVHQKQGVMSPKDVGGDTDNFVLSKWRNDGVELPRAAPCFSVRKINRFKEKSSFLWPSMH